jgi:hypothetical protein
MVHHIDLFQQYLVNHFQVRTDHSSLRYLQRFKTQNGQLARWLDFLQAYDFEIVTRPGAQHGNAGGLSRKEEYDCGGKKCYCQQFYDLQYEPPVVMETKKFVDAAVQTSSNGAFSRKVEFGKNLSNNDVLSEEDTSMVSEHAMVRAVSIFPYWTVDEMQQDQLSDPDIGPILQMKQEGKQTPEWEQVSHLSHSSKILLSEWDRLEMKNGLLYRKWVHKNGKNFWFQLVLPRVHWNSILEHVHDSVISGHTGINRTLLKMKVRFYFPGMSSFVRRWVMSCKMCQQRKGPMKKAKNPMQSYNVGVPCERIASDIMGPFSV